MYLLVWQKRRVSQSTIHSILLPCCPLVRGKYFSIWPIQFLRRLWNVPLVKISTGIVMHSFKKDWSVWSANSSIIFVELHMLGRTSRSPNWCKCLCVSIRQWCGSSSCKLRSWERLLSWRVSSSTAEEQPTWPQWAPPEAVSRDEHALWQSCALLLPSSFSGRCTCVQKWGYAHAETASSIPLTSKLQAYWSIMETTTQSPLVCERHRRRKQPIK